SRYENVTDPGTGPRNDLLSCNGALYRQRDGILVAAVRHKGIMRSGTGGLGAGFDHGRLRRLVLHQQASERRWIRSIGGQSAKSKTSPTKMKTEREIRALPVLK